MTGTAWATLSSVALHGAMAATVYVLPDPRDRPKTRTVPIAVRSVARPAEPAPAPPPPVPVRIPPAFRPRKSAPLTTRRIEMPPPKIPTAPEPARPDMPPPSGPPVFGVTMESIVEGDSSVSADVGNTLRTDPENAPRGPGPPPPVAPGPAVPDIVPPKVLRPVQAPYPRAALEAGVQGKVVLLLSVDEKGHVTKARVLRGLGHGLDEAAVDAVKQFTFSPGTVDGRAGPMEIRYTYTFVIDE